MYVHLDDDSYKVETCWMCYVLNFKYKHTLTYGHFVGCYNALWDCLYVTLSLTFRVVFSNHEVARLCTISGICMTVSVERVV